MDQSPSGYPGLWRRPQAEEHDQHASIRGGGNFHRSGSHVLRRLLDEVNATMSIYHVWGSHLGSAHLFRQHLDSRRRITEIVEKTQVGH